jgi:hypothetical protein
MTCKRIAKLLSERQDHELTFWRRVAIHVHLSWCVFCRRLARHLEDIHTFSSAAGDPSAVAKIGMLDTSLPPLAKDRIKKLIASKNL